MADDMQATPLYATLALKAPAMERIENALRTVEAEGGPSVVLLAADSDVSNDQGLTCTWVRVYRPDRQTVTIGGKLRLPDLEWAGEHLAKGFLLVCRADANNSPAKALHTYMGHSEGLLLGLGEYVQRRIVPPVNKDFLWRKAWRSLGLLDDHPGPCVGACWIEHEQIHLAASHHGRPCTVDIPMGASRLSVRAHCEWMWATPPAGSRPIEPSVASAPESTAPGGSHRPEDLIASPELSEEDAATEAPSELARAMVGAATNPAAASRRPSFPMPDGATGSESVVFDSPPLPTLTQPQTATRELGGMAIGARETVVDPGLSAPSEAPDHPSVESSPPPPATPKELVGESPRRSMLPSLLVVIASVVLIVMIWGSSGKVLEPDVGVVSGEREDATVIVIGSQFGSGTDGVLLNTVVSPPAVTVDRSREAQAEKARRMAEARKRREVDAERAKREAKARELREADAAAKRDADARERLEAEAKREEREVKARGRREAEARERREAEARERREAEARERREAEAEPAKREAEARERREAEARRVEREADARELREAEARERREADARERREADARERREAEAREGREAEARDRREAEARDRREAEARERREAEARERREAESGDDANSPERPPVQPDAARVEQAQRIANRLCGRSKCRSAYLEAAERDSWSSYCDPGFRRASSDQLSAQDVSLAESVVANLKAKAPTFSEECAKGL